MCFSDKNPGVGTKTGLSFSTLCVARLESRVSVVQSVIERLKNNTDFNN